MKDVRSVLFNNKGTKIYKQNGVTIVALIITVILLIILAGVTINITIGDNGILKESKKSVLHYSESIVTEELRQKWKSMELAFGNKNVSFKEKIEKYVELLSKIDKTTKYTIINDEKAHIYYKWYKAEIDNNGNLKLNSDSGKYIEETPIKISYNLEWNDEDISETGENYKMENGAPIPNGFKYIEGTVDTGLVIEDITENANGTDTQTTGNQFVWVPVKREQKIVLNIETKNNIESININNPDSQKIVLNGEEYILDYCVLKGENGKDINGKIIPDTKIKQYNMTFIPDSNRTYSVTVKDIDGNEVTEEIEVTSVWGQDFLEAENVITEYKTLEEACKKEGVTDEQGLFNKYGYNSETRPYTKLYMQGIVINEKK